MQKKGSLLGLLLLLAVNSVANAAPAKGQWEIISSVDEITDEKSSYLMNGNEKDDAAIGVFCSKKTKKPYPIYVMAYVTDFGVLNPGDKVTWRFDKKKAIGPITLKSTAMNHKAFAIPKEMSDEFVKNMYGSSTLLVGAPSGKLRLLAKGLNKRAKADLAAHAHALACLSEGMFRSVLDVPGTDTASPG